MAFKKLNRYYKTFLGLPKSLYLSINYFGIRGIVCPILVSRRTRIKEARGKVIINAPLAFGLIKFGFSEVAMSSGKEWNVWNVSGNLSFNGTASFGVGSRLVVGKSGNLSIGDNFLITEASDINCFYNIEIGKDVLFSWDILVMDTDAHPIRNTENEIINPNGSIIIGDNCWIGSRVVILKNTKIGNNSIVATSSILNKKFEKENIIIAGQPAKVVKENIVWKRETF